MILIAFFIFSLAVCIAYVYLLSWITDGWDGEEEWKAPEDYVPETKISVIIPARNEEKNIVRCLQSILATDYPRHLLEIIVVDDHSDDDTAKLVEEYPEAVRLIRLESNQGKKQALEKGVKDAKGEVIYCTDADCQLSPRLLKTFVSSYEYNHWDFATGPVTSHYYLTILSAFQFLDFAGMMQIAGNGIFRRMYYIANGANMAFRKSSFLKIGGMHNHQHVASGDDMFLIQAMADHDDMKVRYIKSSEAIVRTQPEPTYGALLQQRKRWAAKTRHYSNRNITRIQGFVFFVHLLILINIFLIPWTGGLSFFTALFMLFIKMTMDYLFLAKMARYLGNTKPLKYFIPSGFVYFLVIFFSAGAALFSKKYHWKGRETE